MSSVPASQEKGRYRRTHKVFGSSGGTHGLGHTGSCTRKCIFRLGWLVMLGRLVGRRLQLGGCSHSGCFLDARDVIARYRVARRKGLALWERVRRATWALSTWQRRLGVFVHVCQQGRKSCGSVYDWVRGRGGMGLGEPRQMTRSFFIGGNIGKDKKDTVPTHRLGQLSSGTRLHPRGYIGGGTMRVMYLRVSPRGE